jgi:tRNA-Thr(GGU) m(6)t(6)A37 methyltransferase TsaA
VRPAPNHLAGPQRLEVVGQRLGQDDDVALRQQLFARAQARDERLELVVGEPEALAVPALEVELMAQDGVDALDVRRVDGQPPLVLLQGRRHDAGAEEIHGGQSRLPGMDELIPIGTVESPLTDLASAPKQGDEGAPDCWLVLRPEVAEGLDGIRPGDELIVLTWLDRARRDVLRVHPRGDLTRPPQGVFNTRSPDRPNPIGVHRVEVAEVDGPRVRVRNLEALDGTPLLDLKPVLRGIGER